MLSEFLYGCGPWPSSTIYHLSVVTSPHLYPNCLVRIDCPLWRTGIVFSVMWGPPPEPQNLCPTAPPSPSSPAWGAYTPLSRKQEFTAVTAPSNDTQTLPRVQRNSVEVAGPFLPTLPSRKASMGPRTATGSLYTAARVCCPQAEHHGVRWPMLPSAQKQEALCPSRPGCGAAGVPRGREIWLKTEAATSKLMPL